MRLHLLQQRGGVGARGKLGDGVAQPGLGQAFVSKRGGQRLAVRHQLVELAALAAQHVGQHLRRGVIRAVRTRESGT